MARVWELPPSVSAIQRLILLALADHADDEGNCWPGVKAVAGKTGLTEWTIRLHLGILSSAAGLIRITRRKRPDGSWASNSYQLRLPAPDAPPPASPAPPSCKRCTPIEPSEKRQDITPPNPPKGDGANNYDLPGFNRWWSAYPSPREHRRRLGKRTCYTIWRKRGLEAKVNAILGCLERDKRTEQWTKDGGRYIPRTQTWLNAEPWLDTGTPTTPRMREDPRVS